MKNDHYWVQIGPGRKLGAVPAISPMDNKAGIALVLHTLPPRSLAAPPHRDSREDEFSFVSEGDFTVMDFEPIQQLMAEHGLEP